MAKIKTLTINDIESTFGGAQAALKKAFETIKNATIIECNDTSAIILDEENEIFYSMEYSYDRDLNTVNLKNFSPVIIKEEAFDTKIKYSKAMDLDISDDEAMSLAREIARYHASIMHGTTRQKIIREARMKSANKKINRGRKAILEDLSVFKTENRKIINEIKNSGFYDQFVDLINKKHMEDGATITVNDRINFQLVDRRNKTDEINETTYCKRIDGKSENDKYFNASEVLRKSPTFTYKLGKLMDAAHILLKSKGEESLAESIKAFANLAKNWPVMFMLDERKHRDFAIRHFAQTIGEPERTREYVDLYTSLVNSDTFKARRDVFLKEEYDLEARNEAENKIKESIYNVRLVDETKRSIEKLRENVSRIESANVRNYLRFCEEKLDEMVRTGEFNEDLYEQITTDIFGDSRLVVTNVFNEMFDDEDLRESNEGIEEDDLKVLNLKARANKLVVQMRDLIPTVERPLQVSLEEDLDLVKAMIGMQSLDEERIESIEEMVNGIQERFTKSNNVVEVKDKHKYFCPGCSSEVTKVIAEAKADKKEETNCPHCGTLLSV